jgi:predicted RNase H-like nuclease (RuvC/YqgF family)
MSTETITPGADPASAADLDAVLKHVIAGTPIDAALSRRVRERSEKMTEELRRQYGEINVAVGLVREVRDEPLISRGGRRYQP